MLLRRRFAKMEAPTRAEFSTAIADQTTWDSLKHVAGAALPGSEVIKVVVDRRPTEGAARWIPYFLDTPRYQHHVDFCRRLDPRSNANFETEMYRSPDRRFILLTLTRLVGATPDEDLYWLELWPGDNLGVEEILEVVELIREVCHFGARLQFKASSDDQRRRVTVEATAEQVDRLGPLLDQGAVYRGVTYQGLTLGTAYGRLRILRESPDLAAELADLTPYDVVVTEGIPLEIGPVSGLITSAHQTPLAHVSVLSENRGSPNCAVIGAHRLPAITALEGTWVRLDVDRTTYSLTGVEEDLARAAVEDRLRAMRASAPTLQVDRVRRGLPRLEDRASRDAAVVGAKSAALSRVYRHRRLRHHAVPGFSVPVAHYLDHIDRHSHLADLLTRLGGAHRGGSDASLSAILADLRAAFIDTPVDAELVAEVRGRIEAWRGGEHAPLFAGFDDVIFRSSSNAEDLPGFNGAGLAESFRLGSPLSEDVIADRIRAVWASLWSDRGYAERAAFGIDQSDAAMAVLVQPVVPHAAHVVAITTNTVKPGPIPAYFLNLLPSGALVTDADSASAEQLLLFDDDPACAEVLCFSSETDFSLLPDDLLAEVRDMLKRVDAMVRRDSGKRSGAADVEFLVLDRPHHSTIALLQARPYGKA